MSNNSYEAVSTIIAVILFLISWGYCIVAYGFFLGVVFGWIPALIIAVAAWFLWGFVLLSFGVALWICLCIIVFLVVLVGGLYLLSLV